MRIARAGSRFALKISKPAPSSSVASAIKLSREIVMARKNSSISWAIAAACAVLLPPASTFASQGPGGGMGTASNFTQIAMAVIVYGGSVLIVGTGLIGALRRR